MINSTPLPETTALIQTYRRITKDTPFIGGIAALYAYESQVPKVAGTKMDGLKRFYGITDPQGLKFFVVHHSLDVEHSKVTRNLVAKYGETEEAQDQATASVDEATNALDQETEQAVMEAIRSLSHRKTLLIISHRLVTLEPCDLVYEVAEGKITLRQPAEKLSTA